MQHPSKELQSWRSPGVYRQDVLTLTQWKLVGTLTVARFYIKSVGGVGNIWRQPIEGGKPTQVTHFVNDLIYSFDVSRDGKHLLMERGRQTSDAVLIRDLR